MNSAHNEQQRSGHGWVGKPIAAANRAHTSAGRHKPQNRRHPLPVGDAFIGFTECMTFSRKTWAGLHRSARFSIQTAWDRCIAPKRRRIGVSSSLARSVAYSIALPSDAGIEWCGRSIGRRRVVHSFRVRTARPHFLPRVDVPRLHETNTDQ